MASRSWNRVELIGNLTRDPELRFTPNGAAVCTFGLATNRTYVSDGEKKEEVDFHRLVAWNKLAELCNQLLRKGHKVFISGRLQTRSWEAQDGQTRNVTEIVVEDMIVLTPKSNGEPTVAETLNVDALPKEPVEKKEEKVPESAEPKESEESKVGKKDKEKDEPENPQLPQEDVKEDLPF